MGNVAKVTYTWIHQFITGFIKSYNDETNIGYFLEINVQYTEKLHETHIGLPFSPGSVKNRKGEKLLGSFHDKKEYVVLME